MTRFIENYLPNQMSNDFIFSNEWDVIVLNKKVDEVGITEWYKEVDTKLKHLEFHFEVNNNLVKPITKIADGGKGYVTGVTNKGLHNFYKADHNLISSYTLTWLIEKNIPLPPLWAADPNMFPEIKPYLNENKEIIRDFDQRTFVNLNQYLFGEYEKLFNEWGHKFLYNIKIQKHHSGMILPLHTDHMNTRLHIPLTYDNGRFYWGEKYAREYKFVPGNIYLINTKILHGTTNFGPNYRSNLISHIDDDKILDLLAL
jgi:hypothetical protein